jgi:hypothetical protein
MFRSVWAGEESDPDEGAVTSSSNFAAKVKTVFLVSNVFVVLIYVGEGEH